MVIPGADGGINKAAKEKHEADEQYDAGHPGVESMSFSHTRSLTHFIFPEYTLLGDTAIKAQLQVRVNSAECKIPSMLTLIYVIKNNAFIYRLDNYRKNIQKKRKKDLFR